MFKSEMSEIIASRQDIFVLDFWVSFSSEKSLEVHHFASILVLHPKGKVK